uniref:Uncharacterized protein n=1 Tax=Lepeophtheirus salmonis TaxID=72036 RepID=A0A0K2V7T7_LEPSM
MCRTVCSTGPHLASATHLHVRTTSSTPVSSAWTNHRFSSNGNQCYHHTPSGGCFGSPEIVLMLYWPVGQYTILASIDHIGMSLDIAPDKIVQRIKVGRVRRPQILSYDVITVLG